MKTNKSQIEKITEIANKMIMNKEFRILVGKAIVKFSSLKEAQDLVTNDKKAFNAIVMKHAYSIAFDQVVI